ncbi:alpha/beta hydrolase [Halobacillus kuroshimensis]|uniref:Alpha/beta hydrolase n=1 Tax=Halobacillus kuroshimensis TaxID=302481 RepID=A0ABS3E0B0_9BACI|nr:MULTISPECIES: alpha/beta hydrolase [Halobacillus]MBN8237040.1 alpha/beta hydrolase [Halobacillus kuroshimensis]
MNRQLFTKKWSLIFIGSIFIGLLIFFISAKSSSSEPVERSELTPTLFVHGYKGGPRSFQSMMDRMENLQWGKKHMTIYVSASGMVSIQGNFSNTPRPFVQVLFENNRASIQDQTYWLQQVMKKLRTEHKIQQVNLVGHSMGGLASAGYLMSESDLPAPKVEKLAVIASPFNGIKKEGYFASNYGEATTDLQPGSEALRQMEENKENFPPEIEVLAIAGVINGTEPEEDHWDGLVHSSSVSRLEKIVPFGQYKEELIFNNLATHSGLHELAEVDRMLAVFLWDETDEDNLNSFDEHL